MNDFVEYELKLSTGETVKISELDPARIDDQATVDWIASRPPELESCTRVPRSVVESAVRGNDAPLRKAIGIQPSGSLMRVIPDCADRKTCPMYHARRCSADPRDRRSREKLMHCWLHSSAPPGRDVVTACVQAWSAGRYVLVVG